MDFLEGQAQSTRYQAAIHRLDTLMGLGIRWERLELTVKNLSGIAEDERAALWLYIFVRTLQARVQFSGVPVTASD